MDRLKHAAQVGDIDVLYKCIREEADVQMCFNDDNDGLSIDETPLHIAAMGGHLDFAMVLIYLKPSWGKKLNHQMYGPMHLAVLQGHNELVLALLAVDKDLARVKGKDRYTALHYAAEKGNLEVLAHLLKDCPECLEDVTIRNETALHVAAQNGQLEALEILARYILRVRLYSSVSRTHVLNCKDRNGDTVLHIAASNTQHELLDYDSMKMTRVLVECRANKKEINKSGLTASDLLEMQSSATPNKDTCLHILRNPPKVNFFHGRNQINLFPPNKDTSLHEKLRCEISGHEFYVRDLAIRFREASGIGEMSGDMINAFLVVLGLILSATYQAMINPPGGVWQASYSANTTSADTHVGQSVMTSPFFRQFFALNLLVFILTSFITVLLLQTVSRRNIFVVLSVSLLTLLLDCILLARQVIVPSNKPMLLLNIDQLATQMPSFGLFYFFTTLEFVRSLYTHSLPRPVRFFRDFFPNQIQV